MEMELDLEKARELVKSIEAGDKKKANQIINEMTTARDTNLFKEIGKLTRDLHDTLTNFQLDSKISDLAAQDIPDAKDRLQYVMNLTENAANKTMDSVEQSLPIADLISQRSDELLVYWEKLMNKQLQPGEFRVLCSDMRDYLQESKNKAEALQGHLNDVFLAQDYQDLTGQVIRKIIRMVQDVEESLVGMIKMFGSMTEYNEAKQQVKIEAGSEGPIVNKEKREDVVGSQDDVDDLLSSLGF